MLVHLQPHNKLCRISTDASPPMLLTLSVVINKAKGIALIVCKQDRYRCQQKYSCNIIQEEFEIAVTIESEIISLNGSPTICAT